MCGTMRPDGVPRPLSVHRAGQLSASTANRVHCRCIRPESARPDATPVGRGPSSGGRHPGRDRGDARDGVAPLLPMSVDPTRHLCGVRHPLHKPVMLVASTRPATCAVIGTALHKPVMLALRPAGSPALLVTDTPCIEARLDDPRPSTCEVLASRKGYFCISWISRYSFTFAGRPSRTTVTFHPAGRSVNSWKIAPWDSSSLYSTSLSRVDWVYSSPVMVAAAVMSCW